MVVGLSPASSPASNPASSWLQLARYSLQITSDSCMYKYIQLMGDWSRGGASAAHANQSASTHGRTHTSPRKIFTGMLTAIVQEEGGRWGGARRQKRRGTLPPQRHWRVSGADRDPPTSRVSDANTRDGAGEHVLHLRLPPWGGGGVGGGRGVHITAKSSL